MAKNLSVAKAKLIMHEGKIRGHSLTKAQRGFFGARAGGAKLYTNPGHIISAPGNKIRGNQPPKSIPRIPKVFGG